MAGMKQEYNPNKVKRRKRRPIIYIICEGEETEIKYFKHFRSRNCLVEVTPMTSKHKPFGLMANKKSENEHHTACGTFVRHRQTGIILAILLGRKSPGHKTKKASNISRRTQEYY